MKILVTWIESYEYQRVVEANSEDEALDKMAENCGTKEEFTGWQEIDYEQTSAEELDEDEDEQTRAERFDMTAHLDHLVRQRTEAAGGEVEEEDAKRLQADKGGAF
jgi:hypothetical protein